MKTRSLIQEHIQQVEAISNLKKRIREIDENYNIEEAVFGLDAQMNPKQVMTGYIEMNTPYTSIEEALKSLDTTSKVIYIKDSKNVYVGEHKRSLLDITTERAIDIDNLTEVIA